MAKDSPITPFNATAYEPNSTHPVPRFGTTPAGIEAGVLGGRYIEDTTAVVGRFGKITAVSAAVATLESSNVTDAVDNVLTSVPIPAGASIHGLFTKITLASGKVFAHNV